MSQLPAATLTVGTYSQNGSEGIYGLEYDSAANQFSLPQLLAKTDNPSFLSLADGGLVYVANELEEGRLSTYLRQPDGTLTALASAVTGGASPCYISQSPDGRFVATANYMGGNVSIFNVAADGAVRGEPQLLQHSGRGPNSERQEAPHAHWVQWSPDQTRIYVVDLGIDEVKVYDFDGVTGTASNGRTALSLQPGDGPRHLYFHPTSSHAYILNELSNTITVVQTQPDGHLTEVQRVTTLPADFTAHSQAAHLYITTNGRFLYASNRGHNSIAAFAIGAAGQLNLIDITSTEGDWPRHFVVLEDLGRLIVANQESNNLVALTVHADGSLTPSGAAVTLPQATFIGVGQP